MPKCVTIKAMAKRRIIFFGTPGVAARTLRHLLDEGLEVVAVVSQPDRPRGRGKRLVPTPVREAAQAVGLPLQQPESCRDAGFIDELAAYEPDLLAVVAYGQFLPRRLRGLPRLAALNLHYSLLPAYRGAAPVNWALVEGVRRTGVTVQRVARRMDAGDILLQREVEVARRATAPELLERLIPVGAAALTAALRDCAELLERARPQAEGRASYAPLLRREHGGLDFRRPARELFDRWRGLLPWPGVYCELDGQRLKVHRLALREGRTDRPPGTIFDLEGSTGLTACGEGGILALEEVQAPNQQRLDLRSFLNGRRLRTPVALTSCPPRPKTAPGEAR